MRGRRHIPLHMTCGCEKPKVLFQGPSPLIGFGWLLFWRTSPGQSVCPRCCVVVFYVEVVLLCRVAGLSVMKKFGFFSFCFVVGPPFFVFWLWFVPVALVTYLSFVVFSACFSGHIGKSVFLFVVLSYCCNESFWVSVMCA